MYYKSGLKYYYYFRVCSSKYYCLLKKNNRDVCPTLVVCVQCLLFITLIYNYKGQALLQLYSDYVMYYKPGLKQYYYFRVYFSKYYCLLKKRNRNVCPILVVCVQCLLFITSVYNYKSQALLQLYFSYIMYYKSDLKHYYYFRVYSSKYYCLLKKRKEKKQGCLSHIGWLCVSSVRCL